MVSYEPANDGTHPTVTARVRNSLGERFENALLRIEMPPGARRFDVDGGSLRQVDSSGPTNICYVAVDLVPYGEQVVTVTARCGNGQLCEWFVD